MTSLNDPLTYYEKDNALDYKESARQAYYRIQNQIREDFRQFQRFYSGYREKKKAQKENYTPAEWAARQNFFATWAIAFLSLVTIGVGITQSIIYNRQLNTMKGQLGQMIGGSSQTDSLVDANVKLSEAAKKSADTAADNLIATQRAYVGNIDAALTAGALGTIVKGTVSYINSGKEAAPFESAAQVNLFLRDDWNNGNAATKIISDQTSCMQKTSINGQRYAWPSTGFTTYLIHYGVGRIPQNDVQVWDADIFSGKKNITITGCITYVAFKLVHHTAFCYYYNAFESDMMHLNICNVGNQVD